MSTDTITENFVRSLLDRATFIVTGGKHENREEMQTFAADAGRLCCAWLKEHRVPPQEGEKGN